MSTPPDDRSGDGGDDVATHRRVGRFSRGLVAVRQWRPRLAHGLLSILALALVAGAWVGIDAGSINTANTASMATAPRPSDDVAGRDQERPAPSESESTQKPSQEPKKETNEPLESPEPEEPSETAEPKSTAGCEDYSGAQQTACGMLGDHGFGTDQMSCLATLWDHESGWDVHATNPSSGAYGIPQALPGDKMASEGSDWSDNAATQIAWGLGYISDRYGDPCGALAFWESNNWY